MCYGGSTQHFTEHYKVNSAYNAYLSHDNYACDEEEDEYTLTLCYPDSNPCDYDGVINYGIVHADNFNEAERIADEKIVAYLAKRYPNWHVTD